MSLRLRYGYAVVIPLLVGSCTDDAGGFGDGTGSDGGGDGGACIVGTEGCPCTSGGGCDPGLECRSGLCVDPGGATGGSGSDGGGSATTDSSGASGTSGASTAGGTTSSDGSATGTSTGTSTTDGSTGSTDGTTSSSSAVTSTGDTSSSTTSSDGSSSQTTASDTTTTTTTSSTTTTTTSSTTTTPGCGTTLVNNDGVWEQYYGWEPPTTAFNGIMVERFTPNSYPFTLCKVDACWAARGAVSAHDFDIMIYDDNGSGGGPGTLLGQVASSATGIPVGGAYYEVDVSGAAVTITSGSVIVGMRWDPSTAADMRICVDESVTTPVQDGWWSANNSMFDTLPTTIPNYRSLGVRVTGSP